MDDLFITGNSLSSITKFKKYLNSCFHMKDLGTLKYFLGFEVGCDSTEFFSVNASTLWRLFFRPDCLVLGQLLPIWCLIIS